MPFVDAGEIVTGSRPLRDIDVDGAEIRIFNEALANCNSQVTQGDLLGPLVGNEEDIDLIERLNRLDGHMIGIADADADNEYLSHLSLQAAALFYMRDVSTVDADDAPAVRQPIDPSQRKRIDREAQRWFRRHLEREGKRCPHRGGSHHKNAGGRREPLQAI